MSTPISKEARKVARLVESHHYRMFTDRYAEIERVIQDALDAHEQAQAQWVSVKDGLPEKGGFYLCQYPATGMEVALWMEGDFVDASGRIRTEAVAHWRPLPPAPKEEA